MRLSRGKRILVIVIVAGLIGGALYAARGLGKRVAAPSMVVARGSLQVYVEDTAKVQTVDELVVYAPLGGRVERLPARVGDSLKKGQPVAYITQDQEAIAKAGLAKAQLRVSEARRLEESSRSLFEKGAISENEYNQARAELRMAEDDLRIATTQYGTASKLGQTTLVAPDDGIALEVFAKDQQVLSPGAPVLSMGDLSRLEVRAELLTYDAVGVSPGQKVAISGAVLGDRVIEGVVKQVYPKAITRVSSLGLEQQRVPVIISLEGDPGPLRPGYDVDVRITTGVKDNVVVLPKASVFQKSQAKCVYVVESGVARLRQVQTGTETGEAVEIVSGLKEGDKVITDPRGDVAEGVRIIDQATE
ncbi:MAG: efflux RND transporter periplasmic adaptor subunit [Firmicutes bacterium]|nr:efflux RND transporter periplasmic adaptor subunit [Bacillota bacterium]